MKKYLTRLLLFISIVAALAPIATAQDKELRDLASSLAGQIEKQGRSPVAITSFTNNDYGPDFSVFLVDRLNILLASGGNQFEVVTRDHIKEAFREINLALGQNYNAETFAKIGKAVGARSLIRGGFTVFASGVRVSVTAEIIDVETGRIIGGSFVDIPYTGDIKTMLSPPAAKDSASVGVAARTSENAEANGAATSPSFQNSVIKATVAQFALSSDGRRADIGITVENISGAPLFLALDYRNTAALSDDQATGWENAGGSSSTSGLLMVDYYSNLDQIKDEAFTMLGPLEKVVLLSRFNAIGNNKILPSKFAITIQVLYHAASTNQRLSVGISGIKPPVVKR
jgi:TolB-like protein